jgi:hypothetical protein
LPSKTPKDQLYTFFYTTAKLFVPETVEQLSKCLDKPFIAISKCDSVEKAKHAFSIGKATELYDEDSSLFLLGKDGFMFHAQGVGGGLATWRFYFRRGSDEERWVEVLKSVVETLPVLFGFMCPDAEYDEMHRSLDVPRGISVQEFEKYLSGLYWLTFFGNELVEYIGAKQLSSLKGASTTKLKGGQVMLQLDEDLFLPSYTTRIEASYKLGEQLSPGLFFAPSKKRGYKQAPQLLKALEDAAG